MASFDYRCAFKIDAKMNDRVKADCSPVIIYNEALIEQTNENQ